MTVDQTITGQSGAPNEPNEAPKRVTLGDWVEYTGYKFIRGLIRVMPFKAASGLSAMLWRLIAPHVHRHKRALNHLKLAYPEKPDEEREAIAFAMWKNLGRTMAESFVIDRIAQRPDMFEMHLSDEVKRLIAEKQPMILATLHLGNWELPAVAMRQTGVAIAGVYQRIVNPLVNAEVRTSRAPYYPHGILEKGQGAGKMLMRLIKQGHSVGIVSDLRDRRGLAVPFFGRPAHSTSFPAMLTTFDKTALVAIQCVRLRPDRFKIEMSVIPAPEGKERDDVIYEMTAALQAKFEEWIRQNPDQWMWAHRRWD